jgi:hypothetical protein
MLPHLLHTGEPDHPTDWPRHAASEVRLEIEPRERIGLLALTTAIKLDQKLSLPTSVTELISTVIGRHAQQPAALLLGLRNVGTVSQSPSEGLVRRILGSVAIAEQTLAARIDSPPMRSVQDSPAIIAPAAGRRRLDNWLMFM